MSVDLPAPFSPSRQCTSPRRTRQRDPVVGEDARVLLRDLDELDRRVAARVGCRRAAHRQVRRAGRPDRAAPPTGRWSHRLAVLLDRLLGRGRDDLDRPVGDLLLRRGDLRPGRGRRLVRLQQREAVLRVEGVRRAERPRVDGLDGPRVDRREVPELGREQDALLVDLRLVTDDVDEPDLRCARRRLRRRDGFSIPNDAPSPMPNTTSAPAAMTVDVMRLPPAWSAYDAWPMRAYLNLTFGLTERAPWQ